MLAFLYRCRIEWHLPYVRINVRIKTGIQVMVQCSYMQIEIVSVDLDKISQFGYLIKFKGSFQWQYMTPSLWHICSLVLVVFEKHMLSICLSFNNKLNIKNVYARGSRCFKKFKNLYNHYFSWYKWKTTACKVGATFTMLKTIFL